MHDNTLDTGGSHLQEQRTPRREVRDVHVPYAIGPEICCKPSTISATVFKQIELDAPDRYIRIDRRDIPLDLSERKVDVKPATVEISRNRVVEPTKELPGKPGRIREVRGDEDSVGHSPVRAR